MNRKRILIIDDDLAIANIYQTKFQIEGYTAEVAADGASGLEILRKAPVDAVILDLSLPGMNGLEVLRQIRSRPETQALPVLVFSNTYLSSVLQAAWKGGATRCLSKAICTPHEVVEIVGRILAGGQAVPVVTQPVAAPGTLRLASHAAAAGSVSPAKSDAEFQTELVSAFLTTAPQTLAAMRNCYQTFLKPEHESLRLFNLDLLCRHARTLTSAAGAVGFRKIAHMASASEAFFNELHACPADITPSTIRTIAQAVDKLALLTGHAATFTGQVESPEAPMILVVDDEAISRELILRALAKAGLRALSLNNSTLALPVLEQNHFDLIFLDIRMPKPDGLEVCERLRKMPLNRTTPVVFVTAKAEFENRVKSSSSGGNDFIAKPIAVLELAVKALVWLFNQDLKPMAMVDGDFPNARLDNPNPLPESRTAGPKAAPR